jgi:2-C-methyl-D-erythritol 4-phosphate cytidylyltransferase
VIGVAELPAPALDASEPVIAVGLPVSDTCKEVVNGLVRRTVPRETLVDLTGPWLFTRDALCGALDRLADDAVVADPLQLCRAAGLPIRVVVRT